jgi:phosphate transport system substrate-binding protein
MKVWRLVLMALAAPAAAQIAPPERGGASLEIATTAQLAPTLNAIAAAYRIAHPGAVIRINAVGSDVAMARLSTGRADIAVIGRDASDPELKAYEWVFRRPAAAIPMMLGSIATPGSSPALAVRVNSRNPLREISLPQLAAAFRIGGPPPNWGLVGAAGPLSSRTITLVTPDIEGGTGQYLRKALLANATQLDWARTREVTEPLLPQGHVDRFGATIADAVAADPGALGIGDATPRAGTRIVAIVDAGRRSLPGDAAYPLDRRVIAYTSDRQSIAVGAWLAFVRGDRARAIIARGPYRPL